MVKYQVNIKRIGKAQGTVGWLAAGLADGTIKFVESTLKNNGNHGLWLKVFKDGIDGNPHEYFSQFLAAFNQCGHKPEETAGVCTYEVCDAFLDREHLWSDAAWASLMDLAENWCKTLNALIAEEPQIEIKINRVEV